MTPSKLTQVCQEIIDLGKKTSKRPWHIVSGERKKKSGISSCDPRANHFGKVVWEDVDYEGSGVESDDDCEFIVSLANNAEKLAQACLVMKDALEHANDTDKHDYCGLIDDALKVVEEIFKR